MLSLTIKNIVFFVNISLTSQRHTDWVKFITLYFNALATYLLTYLLTYWTYCQQWECFAWT